MARRHLEKYARETPPASKVDPRPAPATLGNDPDGIIRRGKDLARRRAIEEARLQGNERGDDH